MCLKLTDVFILLQKKYQSNAKLVVKEQKIKCDLANLLQTT